MSFGVQVALHIAVDFKGIFRSLSRERDYIDKYIRVDVYAIRFEFERGNVVRFIWVSVRLDCEDPWTKPDSPLIDALHFTLFGGRTSVEYKSAEFCDSARYLG